ncbi:hypothetical protein V1506DRAFT_578353 [Lipomyces tetrasporus]
MDTSDDLSRDSFAIAQYNRAIHHVKAVMANPSPAKFQITLVCCLIFVCLENLRGNYAESIPHLRAGSRLLDPRCLLCDHTTAYGVRDMFRRLGLDAGHFVGSNVVSLIDLAFYTLHTRSTREEHAAQTFSSIDEAYNQHKRLDIDQGVEIVGEIQDAWVVALQKRIWDAIFNDPVNLGRKESEEIIEQVQLLAQSGAFPAHPLFTFEGNIIPPLVFVCSFYKDVDVRRRAVELLWSMKRRKGVWDSQQVAEVFQAGLATEEQALAVGQPPNGPFLRLVRELSNLGVPGLSSTTAITRLAQSTERTTL